MKRFTAIALTALMVLTVFTSVIPATAMTVEKVDIRGPIYHGANFATIFTGAGGDLVMNWNNFAGFYYDFDNDVGSETLTIDSTTTDGARTIYKDGLVYTTSIIPDVAYEYNGWTTTYQKIGYLAEEYIPLETNKAAKLSKLLIDDDESHTIRTGEPYELGEGYAVTAMEIDVESEKVWLELTKNGVYVADKIVTSGSTWNFEQDIAGVNDVITLQFRVDEVFRGMVDNLAIIKGVWQISDSVLEINSDTEAGILKANAYSGNTIVMRNNDDTLTLSKDTTVGITDDLVIKVADSSNLRFFITIECTAPGTYEIRGPAAPASIYNAPGERIDATNFAGFYYDLDNDICAEQLTITTSGVGSRTIAKDAMVYTTTILSNVAYEYSGWTTTYQKIAYFAEEYIPIEANKAAKLSKLLIDDDKSHVLKAGETYELGEGYAVTAMEIDVEGAKIWLKLTKNDEFVADKIISPKYADTWDFDQDIAGINDVVTLKLRVDTIFQGMTDTLWVIKGVWQISDSVLEINSDTEAGILKANAYSGNTFVMKNSDDPLSLNSDSTIDIAGDLKIKVAKDTTTARIYVFTEMLITGAPVTDTTYPVLTITSPTNDTTVTTPTITVAGTATDDIGVTSLTVNGNAVSIETDGSFTTTVSLTSGVNTITIVATDATGNIATQSITVTYTPSSITGDLNNNDILDTGDVTLVLRMAVGLTTPDLLGDMNANGIIDTGDATLILREIVGLE